jgi:hypothetical protein
MAPKSSHAPLAQAVNVVHDAVLNALKRTAMVREIEYGDMTRYGASYERRLLLTLREFARYGHDDSTWTTRACSFLEEIWSKGDLDLQSIRDLSRQVFTLPASVNEWFSRQLRHLKSALLMSGDSAYDFDALVEIFNDDGLALAEIRERLLEYIDSNEYSSELHDAAHVALEVAQTLGLDHDNPYVLFLEHIASSSDRGEDELDTSNVDEQTESGDSNDPSDLAIDKLFQTLRDPRA